jgi:ribosomal protein L11 methyltransferase
MASEAGFESFEETDEGLNGYVQQSMLDESKLRELLGDFPIKGVKISYTLSPVED